ncbi:hypothetical protein BKA67DRAFT_594025 [Truncatella angustata]|uniref:Uncharacterized protein n=1 Tax=Truncatella angustata TaxID=152316 RepID=A0A9P8UEE9_9PEZI|nr:uncharacterized protein BKA67DRAFT_594025 [Truncatella angustata]KAH6648402.1 hypothetical protein BKA67DRAFT_594025 [Truncatella angustata]
MGERGFLIPPWYVSESPDTTIMMICSIIWGFSLCCAAFTATKAVKQSWLGFQRGKPVSAYTIMIWAEWSASVTISVISWLFLKGTLAPSFELFFVILCLWTVQMQCILQIIINRVSLVMVNRSLAKNLRLGVFLIVLAINISVFCIWIPARLQISNTYVRANDIWDRTEKAIFAMVDVALNCFFIWTVRTNLINAGLAKYKPLYQFNILMVCVSVSLDVCYASVVSLVFPC